MDAVSKAFSLEETKRRSMLKTSIHVVSYYFFFIVEALVLFSPLVLTFYHQCHVLSEAPR